uniref:Ankyrin repeat protein n=1 Tax=Panagrolaimus sp. JU765 TaxID=591449 RepID=A0AC34PX01_9BILA
MPTSVKEMNREKFKSKIDNYYSELSSFFVLIKEIKENKTDAVEEKLDSGKFHVDCHDYDYTTPLFIAVKHGHFKMVKILVENYDAKINEGNLLEKLDSGKFQVDCYDYDYTTPLFIAVKHDRFDMVKILVEKYDAKIDEGNLLGITPLLVACANGNVQMVHYLFSSLLKLSKKKESMGNSKKNEKLMLQSHMQITPMGMACAHGQLDVVKYLLELKIDNSMKPIKNTISPSPIMLAVMNNHSNIIDFFFLPNIKMNNSFLSTLNDEQRRLLDGTIEKAEQELKKLNVNLDIDESLPDFFNLNLLAVSLIIRNIQMVNLLITFCANQTLNLEFPNGSTMGDLRRKYKNFVDEEKSKFGSGNGFFLAVLPRDRFSKA